MTSLRHVLPILAFLGLAFAASPAEPQRKPNILVILSDDVGYSDIGCYGGEIATPNLDQLAANGLRFTQFYNTARCCPTRASLMSGLHPHQAGVGHMMDDRGHDGYRGRLNRRCVTIAEALQSAGYRSYAVGKWHVTPGQSASALADTNNWPLQRGFDRFYGTIHGAGSYFDPSSLVRDNRLITVANDAGYQPAQFYYTDAIADHAVKFIRDHARNQKDQPFFLYTAFTAAHWPLHAKESDIGKYKGRYDGGYEPVRAARVAKMKQLGLLNDRWSPPVPSESWSGVKDKAFESRCMEVYAAQLDSMDQGIGRIVAELKAQGQWENTVIFYLQDNGGCAENIGRGTNATAGVDAGQLAPMGRDEQQFNSQPKQTRDGRPVRQGYGVTPGAADTYIAYGRGWANVSNTPFREYKHWTHEGGISTPLIVHWPAGLGTSRRGKLERAPGQLVDIMATCVDLSGATYPKEFRGEKIQPIEGTSLRPVFAGKTLRRERPLVWEHEGNRAIRDGKWKLVAKENRPWELYDIDRDRTESNDLASSEPRRVRTMVQLWTVWATRANVLPLGAWRGRADAKAVPNTTLRFDLKPGEHRDRGNSPAIVGRGFSVKTTFEISDSPRGVIVAQGGSAHGYALYVEQGRLQFCVRRDGDLQNVDGGMLSAGRRVVTARITKEGLASVEVEGRAGTASRSTGVFTFMPTDGIDVGSDKGGLVGPYGADNAFTGKIESVVIELDAP
jgi:arylsulfatase A-like enzyme